MWSRCSGTAGADSSLDVDGTDRLVLEEFLYYVLGMIRPSRHRVIISAAIALVMTACGTSVDDTAPPASDGPMIGSVDDLKAVRLRNFNLGKSINKTVGHATGAIEDGFDQAGGVITGAFSEAAQESGQYGRTAMSSVVDTGEQTWRDASGRIIDGAGNLIAEIPLSWPSDIGRAAAGQAVNAARGQIDAGLNALDAIGESLLGVSAKVAEQKINGALSSFDVSFPKISIPGVGQAYVPAKNPLYVHVRESQWESANAANVKLDLDFFGLMRYRIGVGCIGFPNGFTAAPKIALNGGCDNPWNLLAQANMIADAAKGVVDLIAQQIQSLQPLILGLIQDAAGGADNPRAIPPLLIDLPVNELLAMCCSLGFPSSKASQAPPKNASNATASGDSAAADAIGSMAQNAALAFTVPELQGINFSLSPDLSPVVVVDQRWTNEGKLEFAAELGFFGLFVASVGMGCMTFGESWTDTPSITFLGGCDNAWNVSFNAGGYTSSSVRLDARVENGTSAPPPVAPTPPPLPSVATPSIAPQGGTVVTYTQNGKKYQAHVFTIDSGNEFVVTPEMEGVPMEYLIVAGGGSGASNKTSNKTGVGGGGAGGVLHNIGGAPLYLAAGSYQILVGAGGTVSYNEGNGFNGGNSSINGLGLVAIGGGGGGRMDDPANWGGSGGGGGFRRGSDKPGAGTGGQGNWGGNGHNGCDGNKCSAGGGGGGIVAQGGKASKNTGGDGGAGRQFSMDGVQRWYAAGGGGGGNGGGKGGSPGAGDGGRQGADGGDAEPNTGSGGGGAGGGGNNERRGGYGGSGIVIIRYQVQ